MAKPFSTEEPGEEELLLVAAGKMRLPKSPLKVSDLLKIPRVAGVQAFRLYSTNAKKTDEQNSCFLGFQRAGTAVRTRSSRRAQSQLRKSMSVFSWWSPVEVHRAIARLHRLGKLKDVEKQGALSRLALLSRGWREILPRDPVRDLALSLLDAHELRAADSLQLAAALVFCQQRPARRIFVCADQRLSQAAEQAGFTVFEFSGVGP